MSMPVPTHRVFDPNKQIVIADNSKLPAYDGSRLYNIRPASMKIEIHGNDIADKLRWNESHSAVTVTHGMECYPIVTVLNSESQIVNPEITYVSNMEFEMDFSCAIQIPDGSPWTCLLTYGCQFGESVSVISDGIECVDSWPETPELNRLYVTQSGARIYSTLTSHIDFPVLNQHGYVQTDVTVIPDSTSEYMLFDSTQSENGHSWQYLHTPETAPLYILPDVSDASVEHCIILTVKFVNTVSLAFQDTSGATVSTWNDVMIEDGDVIEYLCKYDPLQAKWVIFAGRMN